MPYNPQDALKNDWRYTEGVIAASFAYGPDRDTTALPLAPDDNVRMRPGNPSQNQIAIAASTFGYRPSDRLFTIWSHTLRTNPTDETTSRVIPLENDRITAEGVSYIIKSVIQTVYDTQYIAYCRRSTLTEE